MRSLMIAAVLVGGYIIAAIGPAAPVNGQFIYRLPSSYSTQCGVTITCRYLRAGATGTASGADWENAYTSAQTAVNATARGETLYVADGNYAGSTLTLGVATSGTTRITIKKAITSDHGTTTGWDNGFGDGVADFGPRVQFDTDHWVMDGQVGQWASDLPNYVAYGFRFSKGDGTSGALTSIGSSSEGAQRTDITLRHIEIRFTGTPRELADWNANNDGISGSTYNLTVSYVWLHDLGRCAIFQRGSDMIVEYSVLERNGQAAAAGFEIDGEDEHSEMVAMWANFGGDNHIFRYNVIRDWRSTGGLMMMGGGDVTNLRIYGNVFSTTGYWSCCGSLPTFEVATANGVINGLDVSQTQNAEAYVYNNTFVDMEYGGKILTEGTYVARVAKNNLFYNTGSISWGSATHDYNWYRLSGTPSETNIQNGSADPFVNLAGNDWRLSAATNAGESLAALFQTDPNGLTRGGDGTWDRGAFEFMTGESPAPVWWAAIYLGVF